MYSYEDILRAYDAYDKSPEIEDVLLYFISELTGVSIDRILEDLEIKNIVFIKSKGGVL